MGFQSNPHHDIADWRGDHFVFVVQENSLTVVCEERTMSNELGWKTLQLTDVYKVKVLLGVTNGTTSRVFTHENGDTIDAYTS